MLVLGAATLPPHLPASAMYGTARCCRIRGSTISSATAAAATPPCLSPPVLIPPRPRHPFMAAPFSGSFRGPIKKPAHSVRSEMCNVRKRQRRGRNGGGEIPRRLTISSLKEAEPHFVSADSLCWESSPEHDKREEGGVAVFVLKSRVSIQTLVPGNQKTHLQFSPLLSSWLNSCKEGAQK